MPTLTIKTAATDAPVTLDEAKLHLRVTDTSEDALISVLIEAATADAENITCRALMPQVWTYTADAFPGWVYRYQDGRWPLRAYPVTRHSDSNEIVLRRPPVTGIESVKYVDAATGTLSTLDQSLYQLASANDYAARLVPSFGNTWPVAREQPEAVQVVFSCGYADAASVPAPIKAWIKLRIGALYENRESLVVGQRLVALDLPFVDSLLDSYRVPQL